MTETLDALFERLCGYKSGIHVVLGTAGSGKSIALLTMAQILSAKRYEDKKKIAFLSNERLGLLHQTLTDIIGGRRPRKMLDNSDAISRRLHYVAEKEVLFDEEVQIPHYSEVINPFQFFDRTAKNFVEALKVFFEHDEFADIICDFSLNELTPPGEDDGIAKIPKMIHSLLKHIRGEIHKKPKNFFLQAQATRSPGGMATHTTSISHIADTLWTVEVVEGSLGNYVHLVNTKDRYSPVGGDFYIPIRVKQ